MSKRLVTDQDEIYQLILDDPAFTEAVHRDEKGVYVTGGKDGAERRYITQLEMSEEESPAETNIVKVQVPLFTTGDAEALVYNCDRSIDYQGPLTPALVEAMDGKPKQFFYFEVENEQVKIMGVAPWQDW